MIQFTCKIYQIFKKLIKENSQLNTKKGNSLPNTLKDIKSKYILKEKIKHFILQKNDIYLEEA